MPILINIRDPKSKDDYENLLIKSIGPEPRIFNKSVFLDKYKDKERNGDVIEKAIGNIGRWQLKVYLLMFVVFVPSSWVELGIEMFAHETSFWCSEDYADGQLLTNLTLPENIPNDVCQKKNNSNTPCPFGFKYDTSLVGTTIISEWDLVCDKQYIISIVQIMIMFGSLIGGITFGIAADKYGRRVTLVMSCFLRFICGVLSAFPTDILSFTILRFSLAFFDGGIPIICIMMCVEVLGGRWRLLLAILLQIGFSVGFPIMAFVTYLCKNWRLAQLGLSLVSLLSAVCAWVAPESPRWLLAMGRKEQAIDILDAASKENKRNLQLVKKTLKEYVHKCQNYDDQFFWWILFQNPQLKRRTFLASINGALIFMVANGFYQYFGQFSSNPFFDLSLQGVSAIIGAVIAAAIVTKCNRRRTLGLTSFIVAVCSCLIIGFSKSTEIRSILSALILCALGVTIAIIEPLIGELFPTVLRNSGFAVFSIFAGLGTMIAPMIILLGNFCWYLPLATFCFLSLLEIVFVLLLPETLHLNLPETVEDI